MIELDNISEKILKQIIKYNNSITRTQFLSLKVLKGYTSKELADCLSNLAKLEYIALDDKKSILNVTFKGKQYFLLKRKYIFKTIIINFLLPLLVSLTTTLLTLWLSM